MTCLLAAGASIGCSPNRRHDPCKVFYCPVGGTELANLLELISELERQKTVIRQ
jgi:hypothetical protein